MSAEALGQAIKKRRTKLELTQVALGKAAGYQAGAGVAISRIESGVVRPSDERLNNIARALKTTATELRRQAAKLEGSGVRQPSARERVDRLQTILSERTTTVEKLGTAFNDHQTSARDDFFLPFVERASAVEGAPTPVELMQESDSSPQGDGTDRRGADQRLRLAEFGVFQALTGGAVGIAAGAGAGGAAAFATFSVAAMFGTASTGAAISGLSGVAATNATLALLGGGSLAAGGLGIAGGVAVLSGLVAAPAVGLGIAGAAILMRRRNQQLEGKLDLIEAQLEQARPNYESLVATLTRASAALETIAVHGTRALQRWRHSLPDDTPLHWDALSSHQQERFRAFVTVAACHLAILSISFEALLSAPDPRALEELVTFSDTTLSSAEETLRDLI